MRARLVILGGCLFAVGILLGQGWKRVQVKASIVLPASSVTKAEVPETPAFGSIEEAIRKAPELVLEDLSNDPYLKLSDAELKALAETIDLRKESHRRLLDQVTPPAFSETLWIAVMRANVGKMPLKELAELSLKGRARSMKFYLPIAEAIHASPDRKAILASDWGKHYLQGYLANIPARLPNLKEAMALIPEGAIGPEMRDQVLESWLYEHPSIAGMEAVFNLPPSEHLRSMDARDKAAVIVWNNAPGERKEILTKISGLEGSQRNRLLSSLMSFVPGNDAAAAVSIASRFSSFERQRQATEGWLENQGEEGKQKLIRELDALPDNASVRKLRAKLEEKAEVK